MGSSRRINALCVVAFALFAAANAQQCSTSLNGNLLLAEAGSIVKVDADGKNREVLTSSLNQAIAVDFDYQRNILYWIDLQSAEVYALDEGASKPRLVVPKQNRWVPFSIAIDSVTEKLYVGDGIAGTVNIYDLKNQNNEDVISDNLREVRSIGIDSNAGYLFINDKYQIVRTNLDGSNAKLIYEFEPEAENEVVSIPGFREPINVFRILVDAEAKRLYWIDSLARNVVSSDYDGQDRKIVFQASKGLPIRESLGSLALLGNYLYWSDVENSVVYKIDLQSGSSSVIFNYAPYFIKAISCPSQKLVANLNQHKRAKASNYLLFTRNEYLRAQGFSANGQALDNVIKPSQFNVGSYSVVDYNAEADVVYHNGLFPKNHLYQVNLKSGEETQLEPNLLSKDVRWLTYDFASKNLYYFTYYYADQITLSVLNVENPTYSKIIVDNVQRLVGGLAVHPYKGYVFYGQNIDDEKYAKIYRVNSDGSDLKVIADLGNNVFIHSIAVDLKEDRLYWSQSEKSGDSDISILRNSNLDGSDVVSANLPEYVHFSDLAIHEDQIFAINRSHTELYQLNKRNPSNQVVLAKDSYPGTLSGLKVFGSEIQSVNADHPCAVGTHQCSKFCFAVEGKSVCGCPYGEKISADGKTCIDNSEVEPPFKPCKTTTFKCNKQTE